MGLLILGLSGLLFADRVAPVAMVLRSGKEATVQRDKAAARPLREMDLLQDGDELVSGKEGVTLVLLGTGNSERLPPGKKAKIGKDGCLPKGVAELLKRKVRKANLNGLRELAMNSRGGIGVIRRDFGEAPPHGITPPNTATVVSDRPSFSWPAVEGAVSYEVEVYSLMGHERKQLWKASTTETQLKYPAKKALPNGKSYRWYVKAIMKDDSTRMAVSDAAFSVLDEELRPSVEALKTLAGSTNPDDWLLAATIYESHGIYQRALPLYEKLAKERPELGNVQWTLAIYYKRLGMKEKADAARKRAEKLGVEVEER
jgi:hypothetical protein